MRRILALSVTMLLVLPGIAAASPEAANQTTREPGGLDLYVTEANADVETTLRAEGFEVAAVEDAAGTATLEVVLSEAQAEKFAAAEGIDLEAKTNADGLTTAEAATLEAANGFEVWRTWAGPGGLREEMEDLEGEYDDLTQLITIGQSLLGEPIYAMRVTADADRVRRGKRPSVLYNAAQHAREWITPEVNRRLLRHVLEGYGTDDRITDILDTTELWFVLVANPDGYDHSFTEDNRLWRKNLRDNNGDGEITPGEGVDLNRNFATNWGYDNEGSSPVTIRTRSATSSRIFRSTSSMDFRSSASSGGIIVVIVLGTAPVHLRFLTWRPRRYSTGIAQFSATCT
jgi:murein tripeptide amidase MpaA